MSTNKREEQTYIDEEIKTKQERDGGERGGALMP